MLKAVLIQRQTMPSGDHTALLDGGFIGMSPPRHWLGWIGIIFAVLVIIAGPLMIFAENGVPLPVISAVGFIVLAVLIPTGLQGKLHKLRAELRPAAVKQQKDAGGTELQSFWRGATIHRPTYDDRSWVFPSPDESTWHLENRYSGDAGGELIGEHPNRIGTPRPSTLSGYGIFGGFAYLCIFSQLLITPNAATFLSYALIGLGAIWLLASVFMWRRALTMQDTPTSNIRSMAVGTLELVGQVRPWIHHPPTVIVDGDPAKHADDLVAWNWNYEVYVCRRETYTDSKGNVRTREVCNWQQVRSDSGGTPFICHDGTGGVLVHPRSFRSRNYGSHLIQWECRHSRVISTLMVNLFLSGDVRRHRWTLFGLSLSSPCYILGTARSRKDEAITAEEIDRTIQNSLLEVIGEKATGFKPRLERGTELSALGGVRSSLEYLVIPTASLLLGILSLAL
jgi:hypothetical protein